MPERVKPATAAEERASQCMACECCGFRFVASALERHLAEAHLGGLEQELKHLREGARLFALSVKIDTEGLSEDELEKYSFAAGAWLILEETRQKEVRACPN